MGSRAMSHDSIFLADLDHEDPEPTRVLSQENVHSKIKALQVKVFNLLGVGNVLLQVVLFFIGADKASAAEDAFGATAFGSADEESGGRGKPLRGRGSSSQPCRSLRSGRLKPGNPAQGQFMFKVF